MSQQSSSGNQLTSLKNFPSSVMHLECSDKSSSLEDCPSFVFELNCSIGPKTNVQWYSNNVSSKKSASKPKIKVGIEVPEYTDVKTDDESKQCQICSTNEIAQRIVPVPCGHLVLCRSCTHKTYGGKVAPTCIICRKEITSIIKTFQ